MAKIIRREWTSAWLVSPHPTPLVRRPEPQGQAGLTQTVRRCLADLLPSRDALAPALWRRSRALKRQGTIDAPFFHGMSVTLFNECAKE